MKTSGAMAAAADLMSAFKIPGGSLLKEAMNQRMEEKRRQAFEAIVEVFESGSDPVEFTPEEQTQFVDMAIRLFAAIDRGAARRNLRLLAQIMMGLKKHRLFQSNNFDRWANVLETLTRDELIVLAAALNAMKREGHAWSLLKHDLVPGTFSSNAELELVCAPLLRTGLLLPAPALGGMIYNPTESLKQLGELTRLEAVDDE